MKGKPMTTKTKTVNAAALLGAIGGSSKSKAKTEAARANAQKRWAMVRAAKNKRKANKQ